MFYYHPISKYNLIFHTPPNLNLFHFFLLSQQLPHHDLIYWKSRPLFIHHIKYHLYYHLYYFIKYFNAKNFFEAASRQNCITAINHIKFPKHLLISPPNILSFLIKISLNLLKIISLYQLPAISISNRLSLYSFTLVSRIILKILL